MVELKELSTGDYTPDWCPGCGNFGIINALKRALVELGLEKHEVVIVSGIGCSSKLPQWINTFGFHGIHGRGLPIGMGAKIANKDLKVIIIGGDGDVYGEGMDHFVEGLRKNVDVTLLVHNNEIYGLTKGQTSPTTKKERPTKSTPYGRFDEPVNPLALAVSQKAPFVARSFGGDLKHLTKMLVEAISFKGFSYVDVMQPCITFNKQTNFKWYRERVSDLQEQGYKPNNLEKAFEKTMLDGEEIPIGLFYKDDSRKTYEEMHPVLKEKPLIKYNLKNVSVDKLMEEFC